MTAATNSLLSRLPRATELTIRPIPRNGGTEVPALEPLRSNGSSSLGKSSLEILRGVEELSRRAEEDEGRSRKRLRMEEEEEEQQPSASFERSFVEFMEYTKRRDEENRAILLRMLNAVEDIKKALQG